MQNSVDHNPVIDKHPQHPNIVVAAGFSGLYYTYFYCNFFNFTYLDIYIYVYVYVCLKKTSSSAGLTLHIFLYGKKNACNMLLRVWVNLFSLLLEFLK